MTAHHAQIDELSSEQRIAPLVVNHHKASRIPFNLPAWILNPFSVRLFNKYHYQHQAHKNDRYLQNYVPYLSTR